MPMLRSKIHCLVVAAAFAVAPARAEFNPSRASEASLLPMAMLSVAPGVMLAGSAMLTVVAVESTAEGTVWLVESASDGARASLRVTYQLAGEASQALGTTITVTAV